MFKPATSPARDSFTSRRAFRNRLAQMTPTERRRAAGDGSFTTEERALWASLYPDEPALVNGELEWIALGLADLD
jgi:hypothetical protein